MLFGYNQKIKRKEITLEIGKFSIIILIYFPFETHKIFQQNSPSCWNGVGFMFGIC